MKSGTRSLKRILIVDDHPMMRQGLAHLIEGEPDLEVGGEAGTAGQALNLISARQPDLVLSEIALPDRSGLDLIKDVGVFHPAVPVLVVSMYDERLYAERVLRAGGRGYVPKQEDGRKLLEAIRKVLAGQIYVSERISAKILEMFAGRRAAAADSPLELLTDREFEVFQLIGEGHASRQIAERLHLSVKTVEVHRANIKRKLKLPSGGEVVRYAIRWTENRGPDGLLPG